MNFCPKCNSMVSESAKFCGECGAPLDQEKECPRCNKFFPIGQKFCDMCGYNFTIGQSDEDFESKDIDEYDDVNLDEDNEQEVLLVDAGGSTPYLTISDAIDDCSPNSLIVVKSGNYYENLVIEDEVTIVGENGPDGCPVIHWNPVLTNQSCITVKAEATLQNLKVECPSILEIKHKDVAAIHALSSVKLSQVEISNCALNGIVIEGDENDSIIKECTIRDCKGVGIVVKKEAEASIVNCELSQINKEAIEINYSEATIAFCKIHNNSDNALFLHNDSHTTIVKTDISECGVETGYPAVVIKDCDTYASFDECTFHDVFVDRTIDIYHGAEASLTNCVFTNCTNGVLVEPDSILNMKKCKLDDVLYAITILNTYGCEIESCEISECGTCERPAIFVKSSGPTIRNCKIHDITGDAITFIGECYAEVDSCRFWNIAGEPIQKDEDSDTTIKNCHF